MKMQHDRHINRQHLSLQRQQGVAAVDGFIARANHGHDLLGG